MLVGVILLVVDKFAVTADALVWMEQFDLIGFEELLAGTSLCPDFPPGLPLGFLVVAARFI